MKEQKENRQRPKRVLVMDDDESIRDVLEQMLHRMGYRTRLAEDGAEAIRFYAEAMAAGKPFDLVILDLTIPGGMSGAEAMRNLLRMDPEVNAIVCSGYTSDPIMADFRSYGFRAAIAKPFKIADLRNALRDANGYSSGEVSAV